MYNIKGLLLVKIKKKLYYILYEDGNVEDFFHNEVSDLCPGNMKRHPKKKR